MGVPRGAFGSTSIRTIPADRRGVAWPSTVGRSVGSRAANSNEAVARRPLLRAIRGEGITAEEMTALRWVKPKIVVEVSFVEWTRDGLLRYPEFIGVRGGQITARDSAGGPLRGVALFEQSILRVTQIHLEAVDHLVSLTYLVRKAARVDQDRFPAEDTDV
jgi:ATP dependent DNA ligase-like protein